MTTAATNHVFDDYLNASTSQSLQNRAIAEVNDGNWFLGRLIAVVAKPLPTIWAIAKHTLFALGNFLGAPVLNPIVFVANHIRNNPWEYPCILSNGCQHLSLVLYFTVDFFVSPILNIITPNCYAVRTPAAPVQDPDIAAITQQLAEKEVELTGKKAELATATENLAALQQASEALDGELTAARAHLAALQQSKVDGELGLNDQITILTAQVQALQAQIAANPSNVNDQITQLTAQVHTLEGQITVLKDEKAQLEQTQSTQAQVLAGKDEEIASLRKKVADAKALDEQLTQSFDNVQSEKEQLRKENKLCSQALEQQMAKFTEFELASNTKTAELQAQIQRLESQLSKRLEEAIALREAVAEQETELQRLHAAQATTDSSAAIGALQEELAKLQAAYASLESQKNALQAELDALPKQTIPTGQQPKRGGKNR